MDDEYGDGFDDDALQASADNGYGVLQNGADDEYRPFKRVHPEQKHGLNRFTLRGKVLLIAAAVVVGLVLVCTGLEVGLNHGRVHQGVSVEGVSLGGMTQEEAQEALQGAIDERLAAVSVTCVPDDASSARLTAAIAAGTTTTDGEENVSTSSTDSGASTYSWTLTPESTGTTFDAAQEAEEAYAVGRPSNWSGDFLGSLGEFFGERWEAWFDGVNLSADLSFDDSLITAIADDLDSYLGIAMVNSALSVSDGVVSPVVGNDGDVVDTAAFEEALAAAYLGDTTGAVTIPMRVESMEIDEAEATAVASTVQAAIDQPITFTYDNQSWTLDATTLGGWVTASVVGEGDDAVLTPAVDTTKARSGIEDLMGDLVYGTAKDASFDVSSGTPVVVESQTGQGPDVTSAISYVQQILFGTTTASSSGTSSSSSATSTAAASSSNSVDVDNCTFTIGDATVEPDVTTADAQAMGIKELIASYTLSYGSNGGTNREHNIELALSMLNGTILAPGQEWSWVVDMGACDYAEGFLAAGAIGEGGTSINEAGGGICNVATGLFNAVYEAGLDVLERYNHSEYISSYPLGRDCTVSYPSTTFRFENDYSNYILITTTYDGYNMVISVWGTSEGRTVTSETSNMVDNTVYNYRTVTSSSGVVLHSDTFRSYFKDS